MSEPYHLSHENLCFCCSSYQMHILQMLIPKTCQLFPLLFQIKLTFLVIFLSIKLPFPNKRLTAKIHPKHKPKNLSRCGWKDNEPWYNDLKWLLLPTLPFFFTIYHLKTHRIRSYTKARYFPTRRYSRFNYVAYAKAK